MSRLVPKLRFGEFSGEWEEKKLEEVSSFINEKISLSQISLDNYISTENILPDFEGKIKASKLPNIVNTTKFIKHDVLMSNIRPYLKKIWLADINGGASNDIIVTRAKEDNNYKFLLYVVQNDKFINYVMQGAKGVKMPRGDISLIKKYSLSLPKPPEQQKIANCLSSLDNLIEVQNKKVEALKKHKKGLMQGLFPAEGEKEPKLRFGGFGGEWEEISILTIASMKARIGWQNLRQDEHLPTGKYYLITGTDFKDGRIDWLNAKYVEHERYIQDKHIILEEGDILITKDGTIGKLGYVENIKNKKATLNNGIFRIRVKDNNAKFIYYTFLSINFKTFLEKLSAGSSINHLYQKDFKTYKIICPVVPEQQKIANCLSSLDALIEAQNKKIETLKKHKKGLMQGLFVSGDK